MGSKGDGVQSIRFLIVLTLYCGWMSANFFISFFSKFLNVIPYPLPLTNPFSPPNPFELFGFLNGSYNQTFVNLPICMLFKRNFFLLYTAGRIYLQIIFETSLPISLPVFALPTHCQMQQRAKTIKTHDILLCFYLLATKVKINKYSVFTFHK